MTWVFTKLEEWIHYLDRYQAIVDRFEGPFCMPFTLLKKFHHFELTTPRIWVAPTLSLISYFASKLFSLLSHGTSQWCSCMQWVKFALTIRKYHCEMCYLLWKMRKFVGSMNWTGSLSNKEISFRLALSIIRTRTCIYLSKPPTKNLKF